MAAARGLVEPLPRRWLARTAGFAVDGRLADSGDFAGLARGLLNLSDADPLGRGDGGDRHAFRPLLQGPPARV